MTFNVPLKKVVDTSYDIEIGKDLFEKMADDLKNGLIKKVNKYAIITDKNVEALYAEKMLKTLKDAGIEAEVFSFEAGEQNKSRETKAMIEDLLIDKGYRRDTCIIALGGGVVTDLSGFLAATYCRGVPVIYYVTSILAAADASIGGKTAIDTPAATNYIGVFNQPNRIYIDIDTWKTLPVREIRAGLVETIKHACILDEEFFLYLENNIEKIVTLDGEAVLDNEVCEHISNTNCQIKFNVVVEDEQESNYRQILNLGHTIGRALEPLTNYELNHGEAVSIGLAYQAEIANKLGYLDKESADRIVKLLKLTGLPTEVPENITTEVLVEKMHTDKKSRNNQIRFIIQEKIGKVAKNDDGNYSIPISDQKLKEMIKQIR